MRPLLEAEDEISDIEEMYPAVAEATDDKETASRESA
jgi:hypothetical protein